MLNFLITQYPEAEEPRDLRLRQKPTHRIVYVQNFDLTIKLDPSRENVT
jgi:hypothetical protein